MKLSGNSGSNATIEGMGFGQFQVMKSFQSSINSLLTGKWFDQRLASKFVTYPLFLQTQQKSVLKLPASVTDGVVVAGFTSGSSAKSAGLKQYDVITALDGVSTSNTAARTQLYKHKVGDTIKLTLYRAGEQQTVSVKLSQTTSDLKN